MSEEEKNDLIWASGHFLGENYPEDIMPNSNAFIYALQRHKYSKKRDALFNIAEGNTKNLSDNDKNIYLILQNTFGNKVPLINSADRIELKFEGKKEDEIKKLKEKHFDLKSDFENNQKNYEKLIDQTADEISNFIDFANSKN